MQRASQLKSNHMRSSINFFILALSSLDRRLLSRDAVLAIECFWAAGFNELYFSTALRCSGGKAATCNTARQAETATILNTTSSHSLHAAPTRPGR